jgi:hypothetical protein
MTDQVESKREFIKNSEWECDRCHGINMNIFLSDVEDGMAKYFIDYKDTCQHKICFHCIEKYSEKHDIQVKNIRCPKCQDNLQHQKEKQEKEEKYCKCPDVVEEIRQQRQAELLRPKTELERLTESFNIHRMMNGYLGFPIVDFRDNCVKCSKPKYYW